MSQIEDTTDRAIDARVLFDEADLARINEFSWNVISYGNTSYARGYIANGDPRIRVYMHRLITKVDTGMEVDHINGNGLDNRRSNLRIANRTINNLNRHHSTGVSRFVGVYFCKDTNRWRAEAMSNGKRFRLGRFDTETEAANAAALKRQELIEIELKKLIMRKVDQ